MSHKPAAPCKIRDFEPGDARQVGEIFQNSPQAGTWTNDPSEQSADWTGSLALVSVLSSSDAQVTGILMGREVADEAEIFNIAVAPHFRRQGHGAALVNAALDGMGFRRIQRVFLEVRESNLGAVAFYEKLGFLKNGRRKGYYRDPAEDAITMEKKLTD